MNGCLAKAWSHRASVFGSLVFVLLIPLSSRAQSSRPVPDHVPPKRSSNANGVDGGGTSRLGHRHRDQHRGRDYSCWPISSWGSHHAGRNPSLPDE